MIDPVRRRLLKGTAHLAAATAATRLVPSALASAGDGPTAMGRPVGLQLYSLRQLFPKDVPGTLAQIHEHMANDSLVGWGWDPGRGRAPAPGTQAQLGELTRAWIDSGARCPAAQA